MNPLLLVGNANVGKSVLFHLLTGQYAMVSNYPGTTVMVEKGRFVGEGVSYEVMDTPGFNSLYASSEDELVAREMILNHRGALVQVGNAKNLTRTLLLSLELVEAGLPFTLALNMSDEAKKVGLRIDCEKLGLLLGVPVIPTVATERSGIDSLKKSIPRSTVSSLEVPYPGPLQKAMKEIGDVLPSEHLSKKAVALLLIGEDRLILEKLRIELPADKFQTITQILSRLKTEIKVSPQELIQRARIREAERLTQLVCQTAKTSETPFSKKLGDLAMHRYWGIPILGLVLTAMYYLVGDLAAQKGVGFFEEVVFGKYLLPAVVRFVDWAIPWQALREPFIGEYGVFTMALSYAFAIILPIMTMFFICFGILEDSGYLPRLAVMGHRFCRLLGLNGKAVLPLVLGLGCTTMGTMTTRVLESKKDRILLTLLLALGVPCSAQLGAVAGMLAHRPFLDFAVWLSVVFVVLFVVGRSAAILSGKNDGFFLYEIPPIRWPKFSNIVSKTLGRLEWYLKEAVPLFVLGTLILYIFSKTGILAFLEEVTQPLVVGWLRLPSRATDALLMGFLRRDFGAAGFFALLNEGLLDGTQLVVSLVTLTLFVPCVAQYFMMTKERGWKVANGIAAFVFFTAFFVGGLLSRILSWLNLPL